MSANDNINRSRIAVIVTTAAVTLAAGVTVAALGGYLAPRRGTQPEARTEVAVADSAPAAKPPTVVLVPVSPAPAGESGSDSAGRVSGDALFTAAASLRGHDEEEREHHGSHHERGADREREDDD